MLLKSEYYIKTIDPLIGSELIKEFHYSKGNSKIGVYIHGLYNINNNELLGVAWWLPPTKDAALSVYSDFKKVLSLSRLVVHPKVPTNGASFLLGRSIRLIKQDKKYKVLLSYSDDYKNHLGTIYKASNWVYLGKTQKLPIWVNSEGRIMGRKRGSKTLNFQAMRDLGFTLVGRFSKNKFIYYL